MKLEEHIVESSSGEYSRKIWLLDAADGAPDKLGIFLDGEYYLEKMDAQAALIGLQKRDAIPSMLCAFVSHVNGEARQYDLTCNPRYSEFVATDLVGWVRGKYSTIPEGKHFIAGPSLGGLASVYTSLTRPELFPDCLSHSGSFWWKNEWLLNNLDKMPAGRIKFWLSVGDNEVESGVSHPPTGLRQDVTQISACERLASALSAKGHTVRFNPYEGGHEFKPWRDELPLAISWLLSLNGR